MTETALSHLLSQIGPVHVTGFFLVLGRVSPLFLLAPLFSSKMLPSQVRGIIAVGLSIGLTGLATHGQNLPTDPLSVAGLMVEEVVIGLAFAFAVGAVFSAVEAAGALIDTIAGFSFGATLDPIDNTQSGPLSQLYSMVGVAMFIAIGGDAWTLRGLARTFTLVPISGSPRLGSLVTGVEQAFSSILVAALEVAAPALLALLITDVAFGMVSRVVPQLNVFAVGFPLKIGVALLVVSASLPFLGAWMSDQIVGSLETVLHSLRLA